MALLAGLFTHSQRLTIALPFHDCRVIRQIGRTLKRRNTERCSRRQRRSVTEFKRQLWPNADLALRGEATVGT